MMILLSEIHHKRQLNPALTLLLLVFALLHVECALGINSSLSTSLRHPLGINCRGSLLCPAYLDAFPPNYIGTFIMILNGSTAYCPRGFSCGPLNDTEFYLPNNNIVCLPLGRSFLGGICTFTQGSNVPATGVTGALIKRKLQELSAHGCRVCGSVPLSEDNDPGSRGILTVNYIAGLACKGLCPSKHYTALLQSSANGSWLPAVGDTLVDS